MNETVCSILDGESWTCDWFGGNCITFNANGTGELVCRWELVVWIAAEFDWKPLRPEVLDLVVDTTNDSRKGHQVLCEFDIELTLTKRRIPKLGQVDMHKCSINESLLNDEAFLPKKYTFRLEKGDFITPLEEYRSELKEYIPRFALRLVFDKTPYPLRHEWNGKRSAPDDMGVWDFKVFCGRKVPWESVQESRFFQWKDCIVS